MSSADEQAQYEAEQDHQRSEQDAQYATVRIAETLEEICDVLHQIRVQLKATGSLHAETNNRLMTIADRLLKLRPQPQPPYRVRRPHWSDPPQGK